MRHFICGAARGPPVTPPDETLSWTDAQLEFAIARNMPNGTEFVCEGVPGGWSARIERLEPDGLRIVHAVESIDRRMVLYDVYGYLWLRGRPAPRKGSIWDPTTPRPTRAAVTQLVHERLEDPEDLNPEEVAAVYGVGPSSKRTQI